MTIQVLLLFIGLALIIFGADWLVDGAGTIARKAGVSEFVIGLTVVGFGTSCPELVVSLNGAFKGLADIAIGNVIGSNIFNILLILGVTSILMPIPVTESNKKRDIPITLTVTVLFVVLGLNKTIFRLGSADIISRPDGIVLLGVFVLYMYLCFKYDEGDSESSDAAGKEISLWKGILLCALGLAALVFGGQWFVDSAVAIAGKLGVSDKFIAVTLLAGGTSLPELATCIVAAAKKKGQLALGNILGSCVFNILLIIGCSAIVSPLSFSGVDAADVAALLVSVLVVWTSTITFKCGKLDRYEGLTMLVLFAAYYVWLFIKA